MHAIPMQEERGATGAVSAVYAQVRAVSPVVPSPFKSLAINPAYLALAWAQVSDVRAPIDRMATRLATHARDCVKESGGPALSAAAAEALTDSGYLVPQTMLMVELLVGLLEGSIEERPIPEGVLIEPELQTGRTRSPSLPMVGQEDAGGLDSDLYNDIQHVYSVPFVSSIFKILAAKGILQDAWMTARPFQNAPEGRDVANHLSQNAAAILREEIQLGFAGPKALDHLGQLGARDCLRQLLEIYRQGIPQVLTFVAMS
jgi:hypothetical protein